MKIFTFVLSLIAISLAIFNATKLDFNALFEGESQTALITMLAALCAVVLLQILRISKKIEKLANKK